MPSDDAMPIWNPRPPRRRPAPARNPAALTAYYFALFAVLPIVGVLLAPAAVVYGKRALRAARAAPEIGGRAHGWIGVVSGWTFGLLWLVVIVLIVSTIALGR